MVRVIPLILTSFALLAATSPANASARPRPVSKATAEVNVLRVLSRSWSARRLAGLVDPRSRLLADNTEAVCRARGKRRAGNRYTRFLCVVRSPAQHGRQGLYLRYRALSHGWFRLHWVAFRR